MVSLHNVGNQFMTVINCPIKSDEKRTEFFNYNKGVRQLFYHVPKAFKLILKRHSVSVGP